tara:strand:- start:66 stop:740 length:675 start_codon:yes stop_codon:yes gene_type:complete
MPSNPSKPDTDKDSEEWITVGGKKMRIDAGADKEDLTREKMPSARGEKEKNTKEAQKVYKKRFELIKTIFKTRDEVVFAEYNKSGVVAGLNGNKLNIMSEGRMYPVHKNNVFKKSELLGDIHWDTMTNVSRVEILKSFNLPTYYNKQNWGNLSFEIREALLKNASPAGTTTSDAGIHNPIYNPINEEKSVSTTIDDEIKRQENSPNHEEYENGKDNKKDKKSVD